VKLPGSATKLTNGAAEPRHVSYKTRFGREISARCLILTLPGVVLASLSFSALAPTLISSAAQRLKLQVALNSFYQYVSLKESRGTR
jgi:hypothetical protein